MDRYRVSGQVLVIGLLVSSLAWGRADLRPGWVDSPVPASVSSQVNDSFLSDQTNLEQLRSDELEHKIFDPKRASELRMQYDILVRDFQMKKDYGLIDPYTERDFYDKMRDRRTEVVREIGARQTSEVRKRLIEGAERGEISKPIVISTSV